MLPNINRVRRRAWLPEMGLPKDQLLLAFGALALMAGLTIAPSSDPLPAVLLLGFRHSQTGTPSSRSSRLFAELVGYLPYRSVIAPNGWTVLGTRYPRGDLHIGVPRMFSTLPRWGLDGSSSLVRL